MTLTAVVADDPKHFGRVADVVGEFSLRSDDSRYFGGSSWSVHGLKLGFVPANEPWGIRMLSNLRNARTDVSSSVSRPPHAGTSRTWAEGLSGRQTR